MGFDEKRRAQLEQALKNISKKAKINIDFFSNLDKSKVEIPRISSGLISIDYALGGGLPRGDFIEIFGKPHAGKTSLCLHIIGSVQREGGVVAFIDVEQDFDFDWAVKNGVDIDSLIFCQPDTLENALDIVDGLIKTGDVDTIIVDSMAALTPEAILAGGMSDDTMGLRARKLGQFFDKAKFFVKQTKTAVVFTNQWRESLKAFAGSDSPGGWSSKHNFGVRMLVWSNESSDLVKEGSEVVARKSHVKVIKNKVGIPYKETEFRIDFSGEYMGINYHYDILTYAVDLGILAKSGAWFQYGDMKVQGEDNMIRAMVNDEDLYTQINNAVRVGMGIGAPIEEGDVLDDMSF